MSVLETNAGDQLEVLAAGPEEPHERPTAALARLKAPLSDPKDIYLPIRSVLRLENGAVLGDRHVRVRRHGRRNAPPVLVMGGASNGRKLSGPDGWWSDLVAASAGVDLTQYCALGLDFAPLGDERAALSPTIQARLVAHALDELGLDKLHALIGASYGGMVGLAFAALAPERLDALCVISAAHRPSPLAMAWRGVARRIVEFGLQNDLGPEALALARQLAMVARCSPQEFAERFHCIMGSDGRTDLDRYLVTRGHAHGDTMGPRRWLSLSESIDRCSVAPEALSSLFGIAGEESMLETNPLNGKKAGLKRQVKKKGKIKKKVECWPRDDVSFYANIARKTAAWSNLKGKRTKRTWPGGSIMVQLMYETAADSTDVVTWTKQEHLVEREGYRGIDFDRGKTGQPTFIPLSAGLLREIDTNGALYLVTDPFGMPYTPVVDDTRMRGHMITLQEQVVKAGGAKRIYDHLRHSAATEAEEMGMELEKVRHLTAHKDPSMLREVYVQQSAKITVEIQIRRGLIGTEERQTGNGSLPG